MKKKLTVQVEEALLVLWKEAAHKEQLTLSEWVRRILAQEAKKS